MARISRILPTEARNDPYRGWFIPVSFGIVTVVTLLRSLAHILLPDGGAHSIATIIAFDGNPDPDAVVHYVFALWGLAQLAMALLYVVVLARYRNLIPLMWLFIGFEYTGRLVIGKFLKPLADAYFTGTAPGKIGNYVMPCIALLMFALSLACRRRHDVKQS